MQEAFSNISSHTSYSLHIKVLINILKLPPLEENSKKAYLL